MINNPESHPLLFKKAPSFSLPSGDGKIISLLHYKGKYLVVYFYPKDNTPGCTIEANEFKNALPILDSLGTSVLGISPDTITSHCKFSGKYELNFPLLADPDHTVAEKYLVWAEKKYVRQEIYGY
jgi:thioredoxin-dependent peroxiredoxin